MAVPAFTELSHNKVVGLPDGNVFSWCPQMDLLAISMNKTSIWIFRVDGERVYSINNKAQILDFAWSQNGKYFVCSGADRLINVFDSNTGANISSFPTHNELPISLMTWHSITNSNSGEKPFNHSLAIDLSNLDILKALPKLSFECETVETQHGTSSLHKRTELSKSTYTKETGTELDLILVINDNTSMSLIFCNSFVVAQIPLPPKYVYLKHGMPGHFLSQKFIVRDEEKKLYMLEGDLEIQSHFQRQNFLRVIELMVQMISISHHIREHLGLISKCAADFTILFDRYLSNYKDSLGVSPNDSDPAGLDSRSEEMILDLSDMLLTGLIPERTRDYWQNQFGVRGLARLSSVGNNAYDFTRDTIYAQIILAAEKLIIILSDLRAIAQSEQFARHNCFGVLDDVADRAIEYLKNFIKTVIDFVWKLNDEQELFNKFLNWCEIEVIEKLAKHDSDLEEFFRLHQTLDFNVSDLIQYFDSSLLSPAFLRGFVLECPNNEVIQCSISSKQAIEHHFNEFLAESVRLRAGLEKFIAGAFKFKEKTYLTTAKPESVVRCTFTKDTDFISVSDSKSLQVVELSHDSKKHCTIEFRDELILNASFNTRNLFVLQRSAADQFCLDEIEIDWTRKKYFYDTTKKVKSSVYSTTSFTPQPTFLHINGSYSSSESLGFLVDSTKRKYSVIVI
ncbi:hypothetical protein PUMCH_000332 [Australozyma saopauloensis]|uniref:Anaphase-promoting complex subunit 4 n=1 Tax=Australozyma saopauloensis TaxID=291208 RepID=A0AAX4H3Q5_9ASCO|nr:hypothetical protein PUMCH_000332 [[Candida] saopauloensis]